MPKKSKYAQAKRGGSAASSAVSNLVPPQAFENLNAMFSNLFSGGSKNTKVLTSDDMNAKSSQKMLIHTNATTGGAKKSAAKPKPKPKPKPKKGGSITPDIFKPIPDANVPVPSTSSLNMKAISPSQQLLATQDITSMKPVVKSTVFPSSYNGSFAFGGAKTKKTRRSKKA